MSSYLCIQQMGAVGIMFLAVRLSVCACIHIYTGRGILSPARCQPGAQFTKYLTIFYKIVLNLAED